MENLLRPISISLSPNVQEDDIKLAVFVLSKPKDFTAGPAIAEIENEFSKHLGLKYAYSFNSGRSSLMALMQSLELPEGSQVLLQAFTCNAAVNPIRWAGLVPVYVDCDQNYNLSVDDLKKKINSKSRVVMVQHTFGQPADMDEIKKVCDENNLVLIEDCAHSLGAEYKGKKVGTFGRAAFFSFGRDKMISCVYGGMAVTNDDGLAKKIAAFQENCGYPQADWIAQQLRHPIMMARWVLPTYPILGRHLLVLFQHANVLSKAIHWKEKQGMAPDYFPRRLPNALAVPVLNQFKKLGAYNAHRQEMAEFYFNELKNTNYALPSRFDDRKAVYLRFAIRHDNAPKIIKKAWSKNLLIGDWYRTPVDPFDTRPESVGYEKGSCPNAEKFSGKMINLPTHINISVADAKKIIKFLK